MVFHSYIYSINHTLFLSFTLDSIFYWSPKIKHFLVYFLVLVTVITSVVSCSDSSKSSEPVAPNVPVPSKPGDDTQMLDDTYPYQLGPEERCVLRAILFNDLPVADEEREDAAYKSTTTQKLYLNDNINNKEVTTDMLQEYRDRYPQKKTEIDGLEHKIIQVNKGSMSYYNEKNGDAYESVSGKFGDDSFTITNVGTVLSYKKNGKELYTTDGKVDLDEIGKIEFELISNVWQNDESLLSSQENTEHSYKEFQDDGINMKSLDGVIVEYKSKDGSSNRISQRIISKEITVKVDPDVATSGCHTFKIKANIYREGEQYTPESWVKITSNKDNNKIYKFSAEKFEKEISH